VKSRELRYRVLMLNGLLLPGSGHLYIKRYVPGSIILVMFTVTSVMAIYRLVVGAVLHFNTIEDFFHVGEFFVMLIDDPVFIKPFAVSILFWLVSMIDGWRITRSVI